MGAMQQLCQTRHGVKSGHQILSASASVSSFAVAVLPLTHPLVFLSFSSFPLHLSSLFQYWTLPSPFEPLLRVFFLHLLLPLPLSFGSGLIFPVALYPPPPPPPSSASSASLFFLLPPLIHSFLPYFILRKQLKGSGGG